MRERLKTAISLDLPYTFNLESKNKPAAVLILFAPHGDDHLILLTRRTDTVETHKGQMAFPGGMKDPSDSSLVETALRETQEEVGIPPEVIEVIGCLPTLVTITGFDVTPVVAVARKMYSEIKIVPNAHEIAYPVWAPLGTLLSDESYRREYLERDGARFPLDVFYVPGPEGVDRVWGVTGILVKNLLDRIRRVG